MTNSGMIDCPACEGTGEENGGETGVECTACGGRGKVLDPVIPCPSCEGKGKIADIVCSRCDGTGKVQRNPEPTNVIQLPKRATIIPKPQAKKAQQDFKAWKRTFVRMLNKDSQIEWRRDAKGEFHYKFILSAELCKVVYEIQVNERIRAQLEQAKEICAKKGVVMPTQQEIERVAMANIQQEFMVSTMNTMKQLQQPTRDARPVEEAPAPTEDEEAAALAKIRDLRAQIVKGADKADATGDRIRSELAKRQRENSEHDKG